MSRKLVSFILIAFVIAAMFSIVRIATLIKGHAIEDTPLDVEDIKVGAYYYPWYTGNWTRDHSNCVDRPVLEPYKSSEPSLIQKHLDWFEKLRIDFLILSWWGINSFTDNNTKILFSEVEVHPVVELAIMVEPFNESYGQSGYNFTEMYDYIYDNYASSNVYMNLNGRPLLCIFNAENLTKNGMVPLDERFEIRLVGSKFNKYNNWEYEVPCISDTEPPDVVDYANQHLCVDGEIMVCPRYQAHGWERDLTLAEGLYDRQWSRAINLAREGKVNIVMIISWNEFAERTQIEPNNDTTAYDSDPYFLYNKTRKYIRVLRGSFVDFVEEIFQDVTGLSENQCRYNAVDSYGGRLDTIKIIENPCGGYLGVYHKDSGGIFQVRLANSTDLLNWTFMGIIEQNASQPTIAEAPNGAFVVAFEKHMNGNHSLGFHYYANLSSLLGVAPALNFTVPYTLGSGLGLEGTPNFFNITITKSDLLSACVGFHFNNGTKDSLGLDRVAAGFLSISLSPPSIQSWEVRPMEQYNEGLEQMGVQGHIGDRDYGQICGRNFTVQEACLLPPQEEAINSTLYWSSWRILLYDHSRGDFKMLNMSTHFNATSFGNPTFTFLEKSPNNKPCVVCTYFLFNEGLASEYENKSGELIFYKEFETEPFPINASYFVDVTTNSAISNFSSNETEKSISFNVTGPNDSRGFCIVRIPRDVAENLWQSNLTVFFDGKQWTSFESWTCGENTYIYVNYIHSEHQILIVPEFPSFLILPLFMVATLLAVTVYRRKHCD